MIYKKFDYGEYTDDIHTRDVYIATNIVAFDISTKVAGKINNLRIGIDMGYENEYLGYITLDFDAEDEANFKGSIKYKDGVIIANKFLEFAKIYMEALEEHIVKELQYKVINNKREVIVIME